MSVSSPPPPSSLLLVLASFFAVAPPVRLGWVAEAVAAAATGRRLVRGDDDGREGMLARIPPPDAPAAVSAGEEADLRVLMVVVT